MAFKQDDDVNIPEFIKQLSAALGQDLFNDPMISQLGINGILDKYLNIAKQTTDENEYLKRQIRDVRGAQASPGAIDHDKRDLMKTLLDNKLISKESVAKQLGVFDFFGGDDPPTASSTASAMKQNINKAEQELKEIEERDRLKPIYKEIITCQRYAINQFQKRFHTCEHIHVDDKANEITKVSRRLCDKENINEKFYTEINDEVTKLSVLEIEQLYNESQFKHHFELIG